MENGQPTISNTVMSCLRVVRMRESTKYLKRLAARHMINFLGDVDITTLRYGDCEDFQAHIAESIGDVTANSYVRNIRSVFSWAVRRGDLASNPFNDLRFIKTPQQPIRTFSTDEIRAMLEVASAVWRARILAAYGSGLRLSEVLNLTQKDIDFEHKIIHVQPKKDTDTTWDWHAKSYECRDVPMIPEFANLLISEIIPSLPAGQPYVCLTANRYLTLRQRIGNLPERVRIRPDENMRGWHTILRITGIEGTVHDLRRTAITGWSHFLPAHELMRIAGHADYETTLRYYLAISENYLDKVRNIGATGLEPATS